LAYIGTKPTIGNFQICDAISVVNGQAAYTMQVGGVNVSPQSSNHMIVSLNGTIQKPGGANPSFTVSGSTITFASNLATGDVIDFIQILGDVLDLGVPSDATVTAAKIGANAVTAAKLNNDIISGSTELASEPADTDEFLVSDAGTLKRIDYSLIKASPGLNLIQTTTVSSAVSSVAFDGLFSSSYNKYLISIIEMKISTTANIRYRHNHGGSAVTSSNYKRASQVYDSDNDSNNDASNASDYAAMMGVSQMGNNVNYGFNANIFINDPLSTVGFCSSFGQSAAYNDTDHMQLANFSNILTTSANTQTTGITILPASGNINTGVFKLYGVL
jgi:hypothetical protein